MIFFFKTFFLKILEENLKLHTFDITACHFLFRFTLVYLIAKRAVNCHLPAGVHNHRFRAEYREWGKNKKRGNKTRDENEASRGEVDGASGLYMSLQIQHKPISNFHLRNEKFQITCKCNNKIQVR